MGCVRPERVGAARARIHGAAGPTALITGVAYGRGLLPALLVPRRMTKTTRAVPYRQVGHRPTALPRQPEFDRRSARWIQRVGNRPAFAATGKYRSRTLRAGGGSPALPCTYATGAAEGPGEHVDADRLRLEAVRPGPQATSKARGPINFDQLVDRRVSTRQRQARTASGDREPGDALASGAHTAGRCG